MTQTIRDLYRAEVIAGWLQATDAAISALRSFRGCLVAWQDSNGRGELHSQALDLALALLDAGGLTEWAEWCPAAGGLDALAAALGLPGAQLVPIGDGDGQQGERGALGQTPGQVLAEPAPTGRAGQPGRDWGETHQVASS